MWWAIRVYFRLKKWKKKLFVQDSTWHIFKPLDVLFMFTSPNLSQQEVEKTAQEQSLIIYIHIHTDTPYSPDGLQPLPFKLIRRKEKVPVHQMLQSVKMTYQDGKCFCAWCVWSCGHTVYLLPGRVNSSEIG